MWMAAIILFLLVVYAAPIVLGAWGGEREIIR